MPRREFSAAIRRAAWQRANGRCEGLILKPHMIQMRCNAPIDLGEFHYDHIDPDFFGANDRAELENCQVLCRECHKRKTRKDIREIAKVKRIRDKLIKARKPRGRPIPGTKRSGIRKRMSGKLERW